MRNKIIAFDLDDVICSRNSKYEHLDIKKYNYCVPIKKMIDIVNECYNSGYYIIIYTARGMTTCGGNISKIYSNLYPITKNQLERWNVNYHELIMGKPHFDILIDDKALRSTNVNEANDIIKLLDE